MSIDSSWQSYSGSYLCELKGQIEQVPSLALAQAIELFWQAYEREARVVFCGNGGSAATASHLVCDFQKNILLDGGRAWEVMSLTESVPLVTAWGNDTEFANIFAGQARTWLRPNDLCVGISASGNSPNVLAAMAAARSVGAITMGWAGYGGGKVAEVVDHGVILKSRNMQQVEDLHLVIGHIIFCAIRDRVSKKPRD